MGIGKRLAILGCYACAACALVFIVATAPALTDFVISGKSLCIPGVSIQCHESDCGDYFQRCGSNALHEVPSQNFCYKGALLPTRRKDLHSCPSTIQKPRNSTQALQTVPRRWSGLGACGGCSGCSKPASCDCLCSSQGQAKVLCSNRIYWNSAVAQCCLGTTAGCVRVGTKHVPFCERLRGLFESIIGQFRELFAGEWFPQNVAASFTFPAPLSACSCAAPCSRTCG